LAFPLDWVFGISLIQTWTDLNPASSKQSLISGIDHLPKSNENYTFKDGISLVAENNQIVLQMQCIMSRDKDKMARKLHWYF